MATLDQILQVYQELADWHEKHGPAHVRDRFLILAADAALNAGRDDEAERLRGQLLQLNPHHMLKPFASFAEALRSPDVRSYINDLRQSYPPEAAEEMLRAATAGKPEGPPRPARPAASAAIPPTLPVMRLEPLDEAPPPAVEPALVAWEDPTPRPKPAPYPRSRPAPRPAVAKPSAPAPRPAPPLPTPGKLARLAAARREVEPLPPPRVPFPAPKQPAAEEEESHAQGGWVAGLLFGFLLAACVALMVYTLAWPLIPQAWIR